MGELQCATATKQTETREHKQRQRKTTDKPRNMRTLLHSAVSSEASSSVMLGGTQDTRDHAAISNRVRQVTELDK